MDAKEIVLAKYPHAYCANLYGDLSGQKMIHVIIDGKGTSLSDDCETEVAAWESAASRLPAERAGTGEPANPYLPWKFAGGPNECAHGYAEGIRCPHCDRLREPVPDPAPGEPLIVQAQCAKPLARRPDMTCRKPQGHLGAHVHQTDAAHLASPPVPDPAPAPAMDADSILQAITLHSFEAAIKSYLANEGDNEQQNRMLHLIRTYSAELLEGDPAPAEGTDKGMAALSRAVKAITGATVAFLPPLDITEDDTRAAEAWMIEIYGADHRGDVVVHHLELMALRRALVIRERQLLAQPAGGENRAPEVTSQMILDAGINVFALQLLSESLAGKKDIKTFNRLRFTYRGIIYTLEPSPPVAQEKK